MDRLETLEKRVDDMQSLLKLMSEADTARMTNDLTKDAQVMAIYSIVQDLAARAGVKTDDFLRHYEARFRYWHDRHLLWAEGVDSGLAGKLDARTLEQVSTAQSYPSIFDPPPPSPT